MSSSSLTTINAAAMHELAKHAKLQNDPKIKSLLRNYAITENPSIGEHLFRLLKRRGIEELLRQFPFSEPTDQQLAPYIAPPKPILLGAMHDSGRLFCLPADDLSEHKLVNGAPGTGKTNLLYSLALQAQRYASVWIIDKDKDDYPHIIQLDPNFLVYRYTETFPINPLEPAPGVHPKHHETKFIEYFCKSTSLLDGSEALLQKLLSQLYEKHGVMDGSVNYPTLYDLRDAAHAYKAEDYREKNFKSSIKNRLDGLLFSNPENYSYVRGISIAKLANESFVLEIRGLTERKARFALSSLFMTLFQYRIANNQRGGILRNLVIIDECKYIIPPGYNENLGFSPIASILAQSREVGLGFVFADQTAQLEDAAFVQTRTKICMRLGSGEDIEKIRKTFPLDREQAAYIGNLDTGQAIVKVPQLDPFVIKIPRVRLG